MCSVCYKTDIATIATKCYHVYCVECLQTWFTYKVNCPMCKSDLYGDFACKEYLPETDSNSVSSDEDSYSSELDYTNRFLLELSYIRSKLDTISSETDNVKQKVENLSDRINVVGNGISELGNRINALGDNIEVYSKKADERVGKLATYKTDLSTLYTCYGESAYMSECFTNYLVDIVEYHPNVYIQPIIHKEESLFRNVEGVVFYNIYSTERSAIQDIKKYLPARHVKASTPTRYSWPKKQKYSATKFHGKYR